MPAAVLIRGSGRIYLVEPETQRVEALGPASEAPSSLRPSIDPARLAAVRSARARGGPGFDLRAAEQDLLEALAAAGVPVVPAELSELRRARELLPTRPFPVVRPLLLAEAQRRLEEVLASPEETLIALAREEERVERALTREVGAADQWVGTGTGPLAVYATAWREFRTALEAHHHRLEAQLDAAARRCVPNLTALVGPRVAGRLVAAAGGVTALARMSASRLQLLGTRRRPGGNRGPKYGIIARAVHSVDVPVGRYGNLARSLAALSAIAVRADASTRTDLSKLLLARLDRRVGRLRGGPRG